MSKHALMHIHVSAVACSARTLFSSVELRQRWQKTWRLLAQLALIRLMPDARLYPAGCLPFQ